MRYLTAVSGYTVCIVCAVGAFHERGRSARNNRVSEASTTGSWKRSN